MDVAVTPGNVTDATPYLDRIDYMRENIGLKITQVGVDSAYDVSLIHQELYEKNIHLVAPPNKETPRYKVEFTRDYFIYDDESDVFLCPQGKVLSLRNLHRSDNNINYEYRSKTKDCKACLVREKCLAPSQGCRKIQVNIFDKVVRQNHVGDGSPEHKSVLALRQIWCEGTFAAQKARHNLRKLYRRGLEAAEDHCLLSASAINLKRMIKNLG